MNKPLFVVEGKDDYSKLKSLGITFIIKTEGRFLHKETIEFLKLAQKERKIVLLLDPDGPGNSIRERIKLSLSNYEDVYVDKRKATGRRKVGVAETDFSYLSDLLSSYIKEDKESDEKMTFKDDDYISLGLYNSSLNKDKVKEKYFITGNTSSSIINQIQILRLTPEQIKETIKDE